MGRVVRALKRVPGGKGVVRALGRISLLRAVDRRWSRFLARHQKPMPPVPVVDHFEGVRLPASVEGRLVVSAHAGTGQGEGRPTEPSARHHRHTWIANWNYSGMEDNDLRGFVDGRFKLGWNQPTQVHVRLGRFQKWSGNGEWELFRVLQRWEGLQLAPGAELEGARIEVEIEEGLEYDLEVFLYSVHKDWDPGRGGVHGNNNSLPRPGEVWWNEVGHDGRRWGLPGAGFASDAHPNADTPARPLARSSYRPGDRELAFESPELTRYVAGRVASGEPLLFLLKLSDYLEDIPGSLLHLFSANHGDDRNPARRPRCVIEWRSPPEVGGLAEEVRLEHGRSLQLPRVQAKGARTVAVSFQSVEGSDPPQIQLRGGKGEGDVSEWRAADHPLEVDWDWFEVRLEAYRNPVPLGMPFEAELRDTWVTTGPRENQRVPWTFVSPTGAEHTVLAAYLGESRWKVHFVPGELGRWSYRWRQRFTENPYVSAEGVFDVIAGERAELLKALHKLGERIDRSPHPPGKQRVRAFGIHFQRLQRALMRSQTPETFPLDEVGAAEESVGARLDEVRRKLGGTPQDRPRIEPDE